VVRQRSAKPSSAGSIPAVASISTPPGFNFSATVESHGWLRLAPFRWESPILHRIELLGGVPRELEITHSRGALRVKNGEDTSELRAKMTRMFQLGVDLSDFHDKAKGSPAHAWTAEAGFGRLLCGSTLFEDATKIVLTTNTMWRQTVRMAELLVAKCGRGGAFPEQADIRRFTADELQEDCRLGYRAKSIRMLADVAIETCTATTEECFKVYQKLPGIGPYAAAHLLAMDGRHDFIAVDTEFRRFVRETYHKGRKVTDKAMVRRYAKWGRWKYLAYWSELWSS
jgi:3-methyladenine DNA glycosylase/8-oxoguanine DNA glycosylase